MKLRSIVLLVIALAVGAFLARREARPRLPVAPPTADDLRLRQLHVFTDQNPWNQDISNRPVDPSSDRMLRRIGLDKPLHPEFGPLYHGKPNGIPFVLVSGTQRPVPVQFRDADESDPGPYPIPTNAPIEGGPDGDGDRHVLVIDTDHKKLYELFSAHPSANGGAWTASSGAIFDLTSDALRPQGWTSADAAGLPIFPGLARYDEVAGVKLINHALRFTVEKSRRAYVPPARHFASSQTDADLPPMGMRLRLKAGVDISRFPPQARVILQALKVYGMILADNGGDLFVSGAPDSRWDDDDLAAMKRVKTSDFEVIEMGPLTTR